MPGPSDMNQSNEPIDPELQRSLLATAKVAGAAGDDKAMVRSIFQSRVLDGIHHRLTARLSSRNGREPDPDDVDGALEMAMTNLFDALSGCGQVRDIAAFLYRAAERRAVDLHRRRRRELPVDPTTIGQPSGGDQNVLDKLEREEDEAKRQDDADCEVASANRRRTGFQIVRRLLPEMKLARSQQVIGYILDVMEDGAGEVTDESIADALGISREAARKARERGFARLKTLAIKHGYSTGALECIPDRNDPDPDDDE